MLVIFLNACVKRLAEGVGFWGSADASSTGTPYDAVVQCELGLSFGSGLVEAAVRVKELLVGLYVAAGKKD